MSKRQLIHDPVVEALVLLLWLPCCSLSETIHMAGYEVMQELVLEVILESRSEERLRQEAH